mmetsp:Transcript_16342/g.54980  ORF Transcript_16342/g.54980 Transcript_16342/m.54980 type:complete len:126 (+) Transcript_16342:228-605(+)
MFEQFRAIMRREFPSARFDGGIQSPGLLAEAAANLLAMGFMGTLASVLAGDYILPAAMALLLKENRGGAFFAAMAMNMAAGSLRSTGAFEILANGVPIHSKMATGKFPTVESVIEDVRDMTTAAS